MTQEEEKEFREKNKDCFIPREFYKVYGQYANLPEYLRRWCVERSNKIQQAEQNKTIKIFEDIDKFKFIGIKETDIAFRFYKYIKELRQKHFKEKEENG